MEMKTARKVRICPACGSVNIGTDASDFHVTDFCQECGLGNMRISKVHEWWGVGAFPEIDVRKVEEFREMLRKKKGEKGL